VIFFGEPLNELVLSRAFTEASIADIMFVIGTSYVVYPAAYLPTLAQKNGATLIEINIEPTLFTEVANYSIMSKAGEVLLQFIKKLETKFNK
jgi:NAD-dependent deacetylase